MVVLSTICAPLFFRVYSKLDHSPDGMGPRVSQHPLLITVECYMSNYMIDIMIQASRASAFRNT